MGPMDESYLMQELQISHSEWASVHEELQRRVELKAVDTMSYLKTKMHRPFLQMRRYCWPSTEPLRWNPMRADLMEPLDTRSCFFEKRKRREFGKGNGLPVLGSSLNSSGIASGIGLGPPRSLMSSSMKQAPSISMTITA